MLCDPVAATDTPTGELTLDVRGQMKYPCSDDQDVIDLKARRLTQTSSKQSQDDGNGRQGKTDVMRNQDRTRVVVADVRELILRIAGAQNQRGRRHFVIGVCFRFIARAGSNMKGRSRRLLPPYIILRGKKVVPRFAHLDAGSRRRGSES